MPPSHSANRSPTAAFPATASSGVPPAVQVLLSAADIQIGGSRPWDIQVNHTRLYERVLHEGSLGAGESYMDGDWDCPQVDQLFDRVLRASAEPRLTGLARLKLVATQVPDRLFKRNSRLRAFAIGEHHYDIGNDLFERMLDTQMIYSCAYWEQARNLDEAQTHKLEMICQKLQLRPGMSLLDIGCGWGGLARHAAQHHGVEVTGITVSREQQDLAERHCSGLPVRILLQDYRDLQGSFDRIVSVGMFEHVGIRNYASYFRTAHRLLKSEGLFLLHTIGLDRAVAHTDPWIDKYIFPGGKLPAVHEVAGAFEPWFVLEDWHNFGADYDRTLMAWHERFQAAWADLLPHYGERFGRMWRYYLLSCAGFFRSRQGQLWQLMLTRRERRQVYRSVRPFGTAVSMRPEPAMVSPSTV